MDEAKFIERAADKIKELGLTGPTIVLLEAHKPLAFISSQLLLVAQPVLDIFFPHSYTRNLADLLADSTQIEQLILSLKGNMSQYPTASGENNS